MTLLLKNLLFTLIVPGSTAVFVPLWFVRDESPVGGFGCVPAVLLWIAGASIYAWCVWDFATVGRGTPAPIDAPKALVVSGLYGYTRNPMYLGVLTTIAGWAVFFWSWVVAVYGLAVLLAFHLFVVGYEEPHLRRTFGADYERYSRTVRRWMPHRRRED
jgi:protein-S-isoprenylcysteine O-methyltransferase Ste14